MPPDRTKRAMEVLVVDDQDNMQSKRHLHSEAVQDQVQSLMNAGMGLEVSSYSRVTKTHFIQGQI